MTIKVGDRVPDGTLTEFIETETESCALGPNLISRSADLVKGKKIVVFCRARGAFTPTCSNKHLPGFIQDAAAFQGKGVDEIWCVSVNDAFVMGAWGRDQKSDGKVRMLADGSATWTKALGLELDPERPRHGRALAALRHGAVDNAWSSRSTSRRHGKFEVSDARHDAGAMLTRLDAR